MHSVVEFLLFIELVKSSEKQPLCCLLSISELLAAKSSFHHICICRIYLWWGRSLTVRGRVLTVIDHSLDYAANFLLAGGHQEVVVKDDSGAF